MNAWNKILIRLGLKRASGSRYFELDETLYATLVDLAGQENRPAEEIQAELLTAALVQRQTSDGLVERWRSLSTREQEVVAFTCLGYVNKEIALRLGISVDTVKTHVHNALAKFDLHSKSALRLALSGWDFSDWG